MKYALIGCGRIAKNHVKAVNNNDLEFVAACDLIPENIDLLFEATNYGNKDNVDKYSDYKQMINEHSDLELISIATDSGAHAEIALYCIEKGINLIIEKPIAMSLADADLIIQKAKEKNVKVSACHQNRFNVAVQKTRKALESGRFGKLSHGSIHVRWNRNQNYYDQAKWRGTWAQDGGCLMNQCIHGIDLFRWMLGETEDDLGLQPKLDLPEGIQGRMTGEKQLFLLIYEASDYYNKLQEHRSLSIETASEVSNNLFLKIKEWPDAFEYINSLLNEDVTNFITETFSWFKDIISKKTLNYSED